MISRKNLPLRAGFEPARGDPIGFQVQRLNHSAITACVTHKHISNKAIIYIVYIFQYLPVQVAFNLS